MAIPLPTDGSPIGLIKYLTSVANDTLDKSTRSAFGLGFSGMIPGVYKGMNKDGYPVFDPNALGTTQLTKPSDVTSAAWPVPTLPTLPSFPALPDEMKIDRTRIDLALKTAMDGFANTWAAAYFPGKDDDNLKNILSDMTGFLFDGTDREELERRLEALMLQTSVDLKAATDLVRAELNQSISTYGTNLAANFVAARAGVASGLAIAGDNTQNVAWALARDQVAREAARKSRETVSKWASRGFSLPTGALAKMVARDAQATLDSAGQIAGEQAIKTQQLFFETAKLSVDSYMRMAEMQSQAELAKFREVAGLQMRSAELTVDVDKYNAKLAFDALGLTLDFVKFTATTAVSLRLGIINGINGLMGAYAAVGRNETDYLNSIADAQVKARQAIVDYYRVAIQQAEVGIRGQVANQEKELKYIDTAARFLGEGVSNFIKGQAAAADVYSRTAAMALSGLNGVATTVETTTK